MVQLLWRGVGAVEKCDVSLWMHEDAETVPCIRLIPVAKNLPNGREQRMLEIHERPPHRSPPLLFSGPPSKNEFWPGCKILLTGMK